MADPSTEPSHAQIVDDTEAAPLTEDQLLAAGYALFFAGVVDEPLLDLRLAMHLSAEDPRHEQ